MRGLVGILNVDVLDVCLDYWRLDPELARGRTVVLGGVPADVSRRSWPGRAGIVATRSHISCAYIGAHAAHPFLGGCDGVRIGLRATVVLGHPVRPHWRECLRGRTKRPAGTFGWKKDDFGGTLRPSSATSSRQATVGG